MQMHCHPPLPKSLLLWCWCRGPLSALPQNLATGTLTATNFRCTWFAAPLCPKVPCSGAAVVALRCALRCPYALPCLPPTNSCQRQLDPHKPWMHMFCWPPLPGDPLILCCHRGRAVLLEVLIGSELPCLLSHKYLLRAA